MTIAIGADYDDGVIVCADSKVVASDGATTNDMKLGLAIGPAKTLIAIANAAEDGHAATMLAEELSLTFGDSNASEREVKAVMTAWHNSYGSQPAPHLQFIVGFVQGERKEIYLCEPPATVLECGPIAIGRGSRAVEPLLDIPYGLVPHSCHLKVTLLRLAFLMYRAKKDEGSACGGGTHAMVLSKTGKFHFVSTEDMAAAEKLAEEIDGLLLSTARTVMSDISGQDQTSFVLGEFTRRYETLAKRGRELQFPSLRYLEGATWIVAGREK